MNQQSEVAPGTPLFTLELDIKTVSEANQREHWAIKRARHFKQRKAFYFQTHLLMRKATLPCHIRLTRLAPRQLDSDNLVSAFKAIRDTIADMIRPGLAPGQADNTTEITWDYKQEKSPPKSYKIRVEIYRIQQ